MGQKTGDGKVGIGSGIIQHQFLLRPDHHQHPVWYLKDHGEVHGDAWMERVAHGFRCQDCRARRWIERRRIMHHGREERGEMPIGPHAENSDIRDAVMGPVVQRNEGGGPGVVLQQGLADQLLVAVLMVGRNTPVVNQGDGDARPVHRVA